MNLKHFAFLLLLFVCINLGAQTKEKQISISFSNIPLSEAMARIEKASGYTFFYDAKQTNLQQKVSLHADKEPISIALKKMFSKTDLNFEVTSTQIALFPKKEIKKPGQAVTIQGKVVDETGEPIIGANVVVDGTTNGVITDLDGNYTLSAPYNADLKVSYIGYTTQVVKAGRASVVKLKEDSKVLDEVVVVGYGTMKKQDLTGAVNSLKGADLEKEQHQTIQDMLRTGVSGLSVGVETDTKGNSAMMIRGKGTIGASTNPLLVLDGVIYSGEMTDINPNDIERIDVLKDASSAAVYGAQAANGVVLITTKKGGGKKPTINFNATWGASFLTSVPEVYTGQDFVNFRQDGIKSIYSQSGKPSNYYDNPSNLTNTELAQWMDGASGNPTEVWLNRLEMTGTEIENYMAGKTVDWRDQIYQKAALRQDYTVSISGKKEDMSYYSSLNYLKNESNTRGSGYSAIRARVNLENKVQSFLTYGINTQFTARDEGYIGTTSGYYNALSPYGSLYEDDGTTLKYYPNDNNNGINPLQEQAYKSKINNIYNLNSSIYLKVNLPLGFSLQTTYSPRFEWTNKLEHTSADYPSSTDNGKSSRQNITDFYWQWDNMLKWNKEFGKHSFDFTGLVNWEKFQRWNNTMENSHYQPSDNLGFHGIGYGTDPVTKADDIYRTGAALMGRLHYAYAQRYMVTATIRRDGYSAFGMSNPYAVFPSVALGWVFSEEKFLNKPSWFEYGKLRFSWGKNGNRSVGTYDALMNLDPRKYFYIDPVTGSVVDINTFYCYRMANSDLKWETTVSWNGGLDFSFLGGRLSGSVDVYKKKTTDLLNDRQLPSLIGYSSVKANIGEIQNTGIELSLSSTNIRTANLTWRTTFNLAYNKNKINHLYGIMEDIKDENGNVIGQKEADDIQNKYFIGHALDEIWGYKFIGVWQQDEAEEAAKYKQIPGDPKILDVDGNYKYDNDDKVFQGNETPKVRWNMRNEFTIFKNWNVSFSMYSYLGHKKSLDYFTNNNALLTVTNSIKRQYWTPDNPINDYPRLRATSPGGISYSIYKNSSFLRLDNITVGYTFPKEMLKRAKIEALNLNLTMKNVGYITGFPVYDPEYQSKVPTGTPNQTITGNPNIPRTIYFGINLTL